MCMQLYYKMLELIICIVQLIDLPITRTQVITLCNEWLCLLIIGVNHSSFTIAIAYNVLYYYNYALIMKY